MAREVLPLVQNTMSEHASEARPVVDPMSDGERKRPIVVVLGMHRSGTSLCSHLLSAAGVDMVDEITETQDNPKGHWERWEIVRLQDRILALFDRAYLGRYHDFPLPVAWWADPRVQSIKREIIMFLRERMRDEALFGFKDPRTVRLLPIWHQIFKELNLNPRIIFCLRNPFQVARSLKDRDRLDIEFGEYRWLIYMADFFRYIHTTDMCIIEYEEWFTGPAVNFGKMLRFLNMEWEQSDADLRNVLSEVIDPRLRHDAVQFQAPRQPLIRSFYELTRTLAKDTGARENIGYIVSQFVAYQQLYRPFHLEFKKYADETAALTTTMCERDATLAEASRLASVRDGHLRETRAALAEVEQQLAATRGQLDERAAVTAAAQQELGIARTSIEELERARAELLSIVVGHKAALADAEQRTAESAALLQKAQTDLAARGQQLTDVKGQLEERVTVVAATQQELGIARTSIEELERTLAELRSIAGTREAALADSERRMAELSALLQKIQTDLAEREQQLADVRGKLDGSH
jgi:hypothetical protein